MPSQKEAWQPEFRQRFVKVNGMEARSLNNESYVIGKAEDVEDFISQLLSSYRQRVVEELEKEFLKAKNSEFKAGISHAQEKIKNLNP